MVISYVCQSPPPEAFTGSVSGSNSPQISKTPTFHKQRSSSVNSVGSTLSARQRSMSIVSLESPRNSIVSTDDFPTKPTRNNSTSSLSSMNAFVSSAAVSPIDSAKDVPFWGKLPKQRVKTLDQMGKSACAIVSDDEFSESEHPIRAIRWRKSSSERPLGFCSSLKRDFRFKYDSTKHRHPFHGSSSGQQKSHEDLVPSPLSISGDCIPLQGAPNPSDVDDEQSKHSPPAGNLKKSKITNMSQSMFLKKKLLFSKDIQFELPSPSVHGSRTQSFHHESFGHSNTAPEPFAPPHHSIFKNPHLNVTDDSFLHVRPPSPVNPLSINASHELTLRQQNKLISDLNRKWNKSLFHTRTSDFSLALTQIDARTGKTRSKKRARSESVSSADSSTTNII